MRIGICIPFYNNSQEAFDRCEYLLETIKKQTFPIFCDVVVVVDGPEIESLKKYDGACGIKIINLERHKGVSAARNAGIDYLQSRGCNYIGFLDSDDSISNDYMLCAYEMCEENRYDFLDCRFIQGIEVFGTKKDNKRQEEIVRNGVVGTFIKSSVIGDKRFNETMLVGEDTDFINRVINLEKHKKGLFGGMYVYNYGVNPNSIIMRCQQNRLT